MSVAALDWWKLLPLGALRCPKDKQALHWETMCGMRVRSNKNGVYVYRAMCPNAARNMTCLHVRKKTK